LRFADESRQLDLMAQTTGRRKTLAAPLRAGCNYGAVVLLHAGLLVIRDGIQMAYTGVPGCEG
jgi:hypothetical protein